MDKSQVIASILTALFVLGLVAFRFLCAGSGLAAALGLQRIPSTWVPRKLKRWLLGETQPKPTH